MPAVMDINFIERMKGDMSLVSQFYDDPAATLEEAGVSEEFSNAVLRRDGKALLAMGWKWRSLVDTRAINSIAASRRHARPELPRLFQPVEPYQE